ncbi:MAG TPA: imidazolonepropionase [Candidatus Limnocylindrales bacterium]|nr:imidazolonepropionase [Candidatus Limnocylindrales bacterium]
MNDERPGLLVHGASAVATLAGGMRRGAGQDDVALLSADGVAIGSYEGRIVAVGQLNDVEARLSQHGIATSALTRLDARGGLVTPGLIDPHTHLLFGGTRHAEVGLRQRGLGYLEILVAGGGILQTVRMTRAASDDELLDHGRRWLREMMTHGVTTVEAKSGYGLELDAELRLLSLLGKLGDEGPVEILPTFLGAHAVPPEYRDGPAPAADYLREVIEVQLPEVARQGIARFVDVFCEPGVFTVEQARSLLRAARDRGMDLRLHADQINAGGGAELAVEVGARSADHLGAITDAGIAALAVAADAGRPVVATLLPIASFYLGEEHDAPARQLIDARVPVALGTDFNPGTSPAPNVQLALAFAVHRLKMSASEALAALTINAAAALGIADTHGSLEEGKHADLVVWKINSHELLPYWLGANLASAVVKRGRVVYVAPAD